MNFSSDKLYKLIIILMVVAGFLIVLALPQLIVNIFKDLGHGWCVLRYHFDDDGKFDPNTYTVSQNFDLRGDANYNDVTIKKGNTYITNPNPATYGYWVDSKMQANPGEEFSARVSGEVSLCKAYLPKYNLQDKYNVTVNKEAIEIPRVEDSSSPPLPLVFYSYSGDSDKHITNLYDWRNALKLYKDDKYLVAILPDQKNQKLVSIPNIFNPGKNIEANCLDGQSQYSALCGRFSIYYVYPYSDKYEYTSNCYWKAKCHEHCHCTAWDIFGHCIFGHESCHWDGCWKNEYSPSPKPYNSNGKYTSPWFDSIDALERDYWLDCAKGSNGNYIPSSQYQDSLYFWYSADQATGLLTRFDDNEKPSDADKRGDNYNFAEVSKTDTVQYGYVVLASSIYDHSSPKYLQYKYFIDPSDDIPGMSDDVEKYRKNTGGYVLMVKQTACRATNGSLAGGRPITGSSKDSLKRGQIEYIVSKTNPNSKTNSNSTANTNIPGSNPVTNPNSKTNSDDYKRYLLPDPDSEGFTKITIANDAPKGGNIWMRIYNDTDDYPSSNGNYNVTLETGRPIMGTFGKDILNPIVSYVKSTIPKISKQFLYSVTCHNQTPNKKCVNLFKYIHFMLSMYIIITGMQFLLGVSKLRVGDMVTRIVQVVLVGGLINQSTVVLFSDTLFPLVMNFAENIISNVGGYALFMDGNDNGNPLMFMDILMTRVFFNSVFRYQLLALMFLGTTGLIYFIIILLALIIMIIALVRTIAVYIIAFVMIGVLMTLSPIFLTFMLFGSTRHIFINAINMYFKYIIELMLISGIVVLVVLFTIYLDFVLSYSVCLQCALPFNLPFPVPGFAFPGVTLFCLYWFTPWGYSYFAGMMGIDPSNIIALSVISYTTYKYIEISERIGSIITNNFSPSPSSIGTSLVAGTMGQPLLGKFGLNAGQRAEIQHQRKVAVQRQMTHETQRRAQYKKQQKQDSIQAAKEEKQYRLHPESKPIDKLSNAELLHRQSATKKNLEANHELLKNAQDILNQRNANDSSLNVRDGEIDDSDQNRSIANPIQNGRDRSQDKTLNTLEKEASAAQEKIEQLKKIDKDLDQEQRKRLRRVSYNDLLNEIGHNAVNISHHKRFISYAQDKLSNPSEARLTKSTPRGEVEVTNAKERRSMLMKMRRYMHVASEQLHNQEILDRQMNRELKIRVGKMSHTQLLDRRLKIAQALSSMHKFREDGKNALDDPRNSELIKNMHKSTRPMNQRDTSKYVKLLNNQLAMNENNIAKTEAEAYFIQDKLNNT